MKHPDITLTGTDQALLSDAIQGAMKALRTKDRVAHLKACEELGIASNMLSMAELCAKEKAGRVGQ